MSNPHESPAAPGPQPEPVQAAETPQADDPAVPPPSLPAGRAKRAISPENLTAHAAVVDRVLAVLAVCFAFLLASFTARNSDLWMDLAAGRLLAQGQYRFGADPFAYTTPTSGYAWVNHAWLYDGVMYLGSAALGGPESEAGGAFLVALKAVLIALLAGVLLVIHREEAGLWIPSACVALAAFTMSPYLWLRPVCVSLLFLGLTLYLLFRPRGKSRPVAGGFLAGLPRHWLWLPVLFAAWVNLDEWFLLGPVVVALFLLGEYLELNMARGFPGADALRPAELRGLAVVLVLGVAACLLSPHHVHGFGLPTDLWAWLAGGPIKTDPALQGYLSSSLSSSSLKAAFTQTPVNPAGLGFYLLVAVGFAAFALNRAGLRLSWLLLWLVFALLAAGLTRLIPLFAVVGAAVASLNLQAWAARRSGDAAIPSVRRLKGELAARYVGVAVGLVLLVVAWPGWLNAHAEDPRRTHRVAWAVEVNPSYRRAAARVNELRVQGVLKDDGHGFNYDADVAGYLGWFCPGERVFFDRRYRLFGDVSASYLKVRHGLQNSSTPGEESAWQAVFRDPGRPVDHLILSGPKALPVFFRLWDDPDQWPLLYADGRTFVFGWVDPLRPGGAVRFGRGRVDFNALTYGPDVPAEARAPERLPEMPPPRNPWDVLLKGPPAFPLDGDEAAFYDQLLIHIQAYPTVYYYLRSLPTWASTLAGVPAGGGAIVALAAGNDFSSKFYDQGGSLDPAALLLLSARAARRAVADSPEDADSHQRLGLAYQQLASHEAQWTRGQFGDLPQLRQVQAVTEYQRALRLRPEYYLTHRLLADVFAGMFVASFLPTDPRLPAFTFADYELDHRQKYLDGLRAEGPRAGQSAEDFQRQVEVAEKDIKRREQQTQLESRRREYEKAAGNRPLLEKARYAIQLGLIKEALDLLVQQARADATQLSGDEIFSLMIVTGQADDVADPGKLSDPRMRFLYAGAVGDYTYLDQYLEQSVLNGRESPTGSAPAEITRLVEQIAFLGGASPQTLSALAVGARAPLQWADSIAFRGLLALETGDTAKAACHFQSALRLNTHPLRAAGYLALLGPAGPLEQAVLQRNIAWQARQGLLRFGTEELVRRYLQMMKPASPKP